MPCPMHSTLVLVSNYCVAYAMMLGNSPACGTPLFENIAARVCSTV